MISNYHTHSKLNIIAAIFFNLIMSSCNSDNSEPNIPPQPTPMTPVAARIEILTEEELSVFAAEGGTATLIFTVTQAWSVSVTTEESNWLNTSLTNGNAGTFSLKISTTENDSFEEREGTITITCGSESKSIKIVQKQNNNYVTIKEDGTASNNKYFSVVDEKNFYLDYILYTVKDGHLIISGFDKIGLSGNAEIVSGISYNGNNYQVLEIKDYAFSRCESLTSISIPARIKYIGDYAFYGCINLESIIIKAEIPPIINNSFYASGSCPIYVPDKALETYIADESWNSYAHRIYTTDSKHKATNTGLTTITIKTPNRDYKEIRMILVEKGTFLMGAPNNGQRTTHFDIPEHEVTITDNYYISETEITAKFWYDIMLDFPDHNGSYYIQLQEKKPITNVSWDDCQEFINKLNELSGTHFRLPSEAEWEYAARGGNKSKGYVYSGSNDIEEVAWYRNNTPLEVQEVATKHPNELGLYDMSGNAQEWCEDVFGFYETGTYKVYEDCHTVRGGGVLMEANQCRVFNRTGVSTADSYYSLGFRLAL